MFANRKPKVLVVEDNRDFAQLISDILAIKGCETDLAYDAATGFEQAKAAPPDLIFSDINLPGPHNGLDFARMLRADPALSHIPLIAVSGYAGSDDRQRALEAGFNLVFPKPVKFADLGAALSQFCPGMP
jgi:CheY-like chemotaxis protein